MLTELGLGIALNLTLTLTLDGTYKNANIYTHLVYRVLMSGYNA